MQQLPEYRTVKFEHEQRVHKAANERAAASVLADLKLARRVERAARRRRRANGLRHGVDHLISALRRRHSVA